MKPIPTTTLLRTGLLSAITATGMTLTAMSANINLLVDASMEGAITTDGPPFVGFWEGFGSGPTGFADFTGTQPRTGLQALEMTTTADNQFAGGFQEVAIDPSWIGRTATFSGWHALTGDAGGSEYRIEWHDAGNAEMSRTQLTASPAGSAYEEFVVSGEIPAGTVTARMVYAAQSFGAATNQTLQTDDWSFTVAGVPEPSSALLMAFGGLALLGVRRRRA